MCQREDCDDPGNTKPWCGQCDGHTDEATIALHNAAVHHSPYPPVPPGAG
jgi:hypothetical protein